MVKKGTHRWQNPDQEQIESIIRNIKTIAIVGLSSNPDRASHEVGKYLMSQGFDVFPVNPAETEVLGRKAYPDLGSIVKNIDIVDVFRKGEATPTIVEEAIIIGARYIWFQEGVISQESYDMAKSAGLPIIMDRCLLKEHKRLRLGNGSD